MRFLLLNLLIGGINRLLSNSVDLILIRKLGQAKFNEEETLIHNEIAEMSRELPAVVINSTAYLLDIANNATIW